MANEPTPNSTATAPASQDGWTPNPAAVQVAAPPPQQDGWTPNPATAQAAPDSGWKAASSQQATNGKTAPEQTDDLLTNAIAYSNPMMTAAHLAGNKGIESAHLIQARNVANYIYNNVLGKDTYTHNNIQYDPTPSSNYEKIKQRLWSPVTQDEINKTPGLEPDRVEMLREQGQDILGLAFGKEKADYLREHILNGSYAVNVPPEEFARGAAKSLTDWFSPGAQALRGFGLAAQGYAKAGQVAADAGDMVKAAQAMGKARLLGLLGTAVNVPFATSQAHDLVANWDKMSVPERVAAISGIMSAAINTHVGVEQAGGYKQASQDAYADTKGTVSDAVAATRKALGAASDTALRAAPTTTEAIIRASQLGGKGYEKQKANVVKAGPAIDKILTENPNVQGPGETAQAIHRWVQAREADLQNVSHATKDSAEPVSPTLETDVRTSLDKFFAENKGQYGNDEQVEKAKQAILSRIMQGTAGDPNNPLRMPNAFEAENIRRGLNDEVEPQIGGEPTTNAYRAAANETVKTLRESIDGFYHRNGVKNVEEFRQQEATLIDVAKRLDAAQKRADDMGNGGLWAALYRKIGAPATIGTIIAGSFHPISFGVLAPYLLGERIYQNYKNPNVNIRRAVELANPNAKPIDIEHEEVPPMQEPSAGFPGTVPPGALPPVHPVEAGQAAHAAAPLTQPEPPTNHTLNAKLAEHFGQPLNHVDEDGNPVTLQDRIDHVRSDLEAQRRTGVDVSKTGTGKMNGLITEHEANLANALTEHQEEMREQAAKDAAVRQKENQAAIDKEAAEKKAAAKKAETDAAAKSDALKNDPRIIHGAGGLMPATEPVRAIVGAGDHTSEQAHGHEGGGHTIAYASQGLDPFEFISDTHPKAIEKGAAAAIRTRIGAAAPGVEGVFQRVIGMLGGPAWDEVHSDMPDIIDHPEGNRAGRDDLKQAKDALRDEAGLTPSEIEVVLRDLYNTAKEVVSKPEAVALAKANIAVRELGLPDTHHMSETRMTAYVKALKELYGHGETTTTPTTDGGVSGKANGAVPEGKSDLGGAEAEKPSGRAEEVHAGEVREGEGKPQEGARGSGPGVEQANLRRTLETAREKKFKVSGTDEHGNPIDEEIYAHSFNKARKMAEAKHEGARQLAVDVTGESEPYGEYQLPEEEADDHR